MLHRVEDPVFSILVITNCFTTAPSLHWAEIGIIYELEQLINRKLHCIQSLNLFSPNILLKNLLGSCRELPKREYTLERHWRRFCNWQKMFECEQNFGRFSEGKTISELFEQCSKFLPYFKSIANQRTERKITSESNKFSSSNNFLGK